MIPENQNMSDPAIGTVDDLFALSEFDRSAALGAPEIVAQLLSDLEFFPAAVAEIGMWQIFRTA
jgi:hypothetical protein